MPLAGAWVNRWQVSPPLPLPLPHLQSFVSLRYRTFLLGTENAVGGGMGLWLSMPSCFLPNPTIFQFHHNFYHKCLPQILPQILPQTTTTYHYHNWGVNIYYHTNFCSQSELFSILPHILLHMLPQFLPQTTTTISTAPPTKFSVPKINTYKCFERPAKIFIA